MTYLALTAFTFLNVLYWVLCCLTTLSAERKNVRFVYSKTSKKWCHGCRVWRCKYNWDCTTVKYKDRVLFTNVTLSSCSKIWKLSELSYFYVLNTSSQSMSLVMSSAKSYMAHSDSDSEGFPKGYSCTMYTFAHIWTLIPIPNGCVGNSNLTARQTSSQTSIGLFILTWLLSGNFL